MEQSDSASLGAALRAAHAHRCAEGRVLEGDELPGFGSVWGDPMNLWILWCSSLISEKETCLITVHCGTSFESHECFGGKHLISAKSQIHRRADLLFELRKGGRCGWLQY